MSLSRLAIRQKLFVIVGLFMLPIGLLVGLFVQQSLKDIAFSDKERDGVAYLRAVWPVLHGVVQASMNAPPAKPVADYAASEARFGSAMETAPAAKTLQDALTKIGWPNRPISRNADGLAA